ncbi:MAG TPA: DUF2683 family protein [Candidatus Diapherotrites archaeon]|uniref:DUF2683 family protein n=1 Tax=Candidatus Iainarchaeum sp. TaxID=3101447 RepID=A0A7J4J2U7_9ARCH|nr:DUF2683 family protein [Candidatus Diapherotrites archaeon]
MPTAIVKLDEDANRIINVVKAKYGLKDKSEAINRIATEYGNEILEPGLRPEYIEKLEKIQKSGKFVKVTRIEDIWK